MNKFSLEGKEDKTILCSFCVGPDATKGSSGPYGGAKRASQPEGWVRDSFSLEKDWILKERHNSRAEVKEGTPG